MFLSNNIISYFRTKFHASKILHICIHIKDMTIVFLLGCMKFYEPAAIYITMPQIVKYFSKIFPMQNISQSIPKICTLSADYYGENHSKQLFTGLLKKNLF